MTNVVIADIADEQLVVIDILLTDVTDYVFILFHLGLLFDFDSVIIHHHPLALFSTEGTLRTLLEPSFEAL